MKATPAPRPDVLLPRSPGGRCRGGTFPRQSDDPALPQLRSSRPGSALQTLFRTAGGWLNEAVRSPRVLVHRSSAACGCRCLRFEDIQLSTPARECFSLFVVPSCPARSNRRGHVDGRSCRSANCVSGRGHASLGRRGKRFLPADWSGTVYCSERASQTSEPTEEIHGWGDLWGNWIIRMMRRNQSLRSARSRCNAGRSR